ncbi:MAG: DNA mismatch repair protein MutL [Phototrophicales bacterium]|nr:MAG: DNA mismatch repair protein MutL [Phototrophicales bacterium]
MPIRVLPTLLAAQIAAGEVIERPASVVKELIENALDAGATALNIEIHGSGTKLLRVRDNGHGIPANELELAIARHATSKIQSVDDLNHIRTLGFRGEALHSIAAVSRLTLTSCHHKQPTGAQLIAEGGQIKDIRSVGSAIGTTVEVADLFYNVPARRKFLKSDATEKRHVVAVVNQYAMAYPKVRFQLIIDGRETFHTSGNGKLGDVIVAVMGLDTFRSMIEVAPLAPLRDDLPFIEVYGFTTLPEVNRANRSHIYLFVNGRAITDQRLTYAVVQAYHTLIPSGRYPLAVLMINIDPEDVDVNVHPTKAEVRFRSPDAVFSAVQRTVRHAITQKMSPVHVRQTPTPEIDTDTKQATWPPSSTSSISKSSTSPTNSKRRQQLDFDLDTPNIGRYSHQIGQSQTDEAFLEEANYPHDKIVSPPYIQPKESDDPTAIPITIGKPKRPRTLPILRVVGQLKATYIITEGPAGMYLIDQHAAHERILYEELMAAYSQKQVITQQVLDTFILELGSAQSQALFTYKDELANVGFTFEEFGRNTFKVISVPALLSDRDPAQVLYGLLDDLANGDPAGEAEIEAKIVKRICKGIAVKAGQVLSHHEMQNLVHQLERCENPFTCPHGRPTFIHLSNEALEREFGRA